MPVRLHYFRRCIIECCDWSLHQSKKPLICYCCLNNIIFRVLHVTTDSDISAALFHPHLCLSNIARLLMRGYSTFRACASVTAGSDKNFRYNNSALSIYDGVKCLLMFAALRRIPSLHLFAYSVEIRSCVLRFSAVHVL